MSRSSNIREFLQNAGSTIVSVEFVKKNGEIRKIQFNPRDTNEIRGFGPSTQDPNIIRVRDFKIAKQNGSGAWRSFHADRVISITANGNKFDFTS